MKINKSENDERYILLLREPVNSFVSINSLSMCSGWKDLVIVSIYTHSSNNIYTYYIVIH